jgi:hypothetical protein
MSQALHCNRFRWSLCFAVALLLGCSENEAPDDELHPVKAAEIARIVPAREALAGAHVPTLDPATMHEAEVRKALGAGSRCDFRYTSTGKTVLAISQSDATSGRAVVKLNGHLVMLTQAPQASSGEPTVRFLLFADPIRITIDPDQQAQNGERTNLRRREANMIFEIAQSLRVGYRGYLDCTSEPRTIG